MVSYLWYSYCLRDGFKHYVEGFFALEVKSCESYSGNSKIIRQAFLKASHAFIFSKLV